MSELLPPPVIGSALQAPAVIRTTLSVGQGLAGPPGVGAFNDYLHNQPVASATWVINHNLNRNVSVSLRTTGGFEFQADLVQVSLNQVQALLAAPLAGTARVI
jgi:hypothetical protein